MKPACKKILNYFLTCSLIILPGIAFSLSSFVLSQESAMIPSAELFISEYIEGSSNNKALEIYNPTDSTVDLASGNYKIEFYFNGNSTPGPAILLSGALAAGDVFVIAHGSANPLILAVTDVQSGSVSFNGNDAVVLKKEDLVIDALGQIGVNPGTEWGSGPVSTADNTLVKKCWVTAGDDNGTDAFDPSVEWDGYSQDTFGYLGAHSFCPPTPTPTETPTPTFTPTPTPTSTPSPTPSPTPTETPTPTPTETPIPISTLTPSPTSTPSAPHPHRQFFQKYLRLFISHFFSRFCHFRWGPD